MNRQDFAAVAAAAGTAIATESPLLALAGGLGLRGMAHLLSRVLPKTYVPRQGDHVTYQMAGLSLVGKVVRQDSRTMNYMVLFPPSTYFSLPSHRLARVEGEVDLDKFRFEERACVMVADVYSPYYHRFGEVAAVDGDFCTVLHPAPRSPGKYKPNLLRVPKSSLMYLPRLPVADGKRVSVNNPKNPFHGLCGNVMERLPAAKIGRLTKVVVLDNGLQSTFYSWELEPTTCTTQGLPQPNRHLFSVGDHVQGGNKWGDVVSEMPEGHAPNYMVGMDYDGHYFAWEFEPVVAPKAPPKVELIARVPTDLFQASVTSLEITLPTTVTPPIVMAAAPPDGLSHITLTAFEPCCIIECGVPTVTTAPVEKFKVGDLVKYPMGRRWIVGKVVASYEQSGVRHYFVNFTHSQVPGKHIPIPETLLSSTTLAIPAIGLGSSVLVVDQEDIFYGRHGNFGITSGCLTTGPSRDEQIHLLGTSSRLAGVVPPEPGHECEYPPVTVNNALNPLHGLSGQLVIHGSRYSVAEIGGKETSFYSSELVLVPSVPPQPYRGRNSSPVPEVGTVVRRINRVSAVGVILEKGLNPVIRLENGENYFAWEWEEVAPVGQNSVPAPEQPKPFLGGALMSRRFLEFTRDNSPRAADGDLVTLRTFKGNVLGRLMNATTGVVNFEMCRTYLPHPHHALVKSPNQDVKFDGRGLLPAEGESAAVLNPRSPLYGYYGKFSQGHLVTPWGGEIEVDSSRIAIGRLQGTPEPLFPEDVRVNNPWNYHYGKTGKVLSLGRRLLTLRLKDETFISVYPWELDPETTHAPTPSRVTLGHVKAQVVNPRSYDFGKVVLVKSFLTKDIVDAGTDNYFFTWELEAI